MLIVINKKTRRSLNKEKVTLIPTTKKSTFYEKHYIHCNLFI